MAKSSIAVPSSFDDQLEALITRIKSEGWDKKFSLDVKTLDVDLKGQRSEKQKDVKLLQDYEAFHRLFTVAQGERYGRYMQALEILRAAHRTQPDVLKSLEPFKRQSTPRKKPSQPSSVIRRSIANAGAGGVVPTGKTARRWGA
jgi:hypothetical protein